VTDSEKKHAAGRLCEECGDGARWYPVSVQKLDELFRDHIKRTPGVLNGYAIRKNVCYGIQYLQYLTATLEQLSLSGVLLTLTYKNFIVTGIGVVEAILFHELKKRGLHKTDQWELVKRSTSTEFNHGSEIFRNEIALWRKRDAPIDENLAFDRILRISEDKKVLGSSSKFYARMHHLRRLRNKVHLFVTAGDLDSDWNAFQFKDLELMKSLLHELLTGSLFAPSKEQRSYFNFLRPWKTLREPAETA
jgi:hypothetical protein